MGLCESGSCNTDSIHIDINTTSICNIQCTYCSEGNECGLSTLYLKNSEVKVEDLINRLGKDPAKHKTINFWGGEPFVNWEMCKAIIDGFKDDKSFSFFFYTNGLFIPKYIDELNAYQKEFGYQQINGQSRLTLQISFDGVWLSNNIRIDKSGKGTSEKVIEAYKLLKENNISTSLKAVISTEGFPHLFDSFKDLYELQGFYSPTPDLWSDASPEEYEKDLAVLAEQLEKIASFIYANNLDPDVFSWFGKSKAICSTGANMISVDLDGKLYSCHASMYLEDKTDATLGHIDNFTEVKEKAMAEYKMINKMIPPECQSCEVNYCMKCQVANVTKSNKATYAERFTDYQANWQVCTLFKLNDKYNKTVRYAVANKENK